MKIGIDARMYRSTIAGIGRYSQNLVRNLLEMDLENEYVLFMTEEDRKEFENQNIEHPKLKIVETSIKHYSIAEQIKLPRVIEAEKVDLMHFLNFNYPVLYKGKFIPVIHDLTLLFFPGTARKTNWVKKAAFSYVMKKACRNSFKIIAVSESTKKDIEKVFKIDSEKINVIYEAADDRTFNDYTDEDIVNLRKKYNITEPVILYVGQQRPHKNLPGLVEAFNLIRKDMPCKLAIIGKPDLAHKRLINSIDNSEKKGDIIMPGFVSDKELSAWYKIARTFVFPSLYEGFGLPGLEAMAAGTPVVCSNQSSLPEIYKNAAIYFDPFNPNDIADKIKLVLTNDEVRSDLVLKGKEVVQIYSWKKTAEETLKLYKQVLAEQ